eukprot:3017951-Prymnesium_polylepis.1
MMNGSDRMNNDERRMVNCKFDYESFGPRLATGRRKEATLFTALSRVRTLRPLHENKEAAQEARLPRGSAFITVYAFSGCWCCKCAHTSQRPCAARHRPPLDTTTTASDTRRCRHTYRDTGHGQGQPGHAVWRLRPAHTWTVSYTHLRAHETLMNL